jgi:hypothetical protein
MMQGFLVGYYMELEQEVVQVFTDYSMTFHWFKKNLTLPSALPRRAHGKLLVTVTIHGVQKITI